MKIKILKVDSVAYAKGFRRGQIREVIGSEDTPVCNPSRGPLAFVCSQSGHVEGFFPDQYRIKVKPKSGEFDAEDDDFSFVDPFTPAG